MGKVYIYGLVDTRNNNIFYVGSTQKPEERKRKYINQGGTRLAARILIREIKKSGVEHEFIILDECDKELRDERESFWIQKCKNDGNTLLNKRVPYYGRTHEAARQYYGEFAPTNFND